MAVRELIRRRVRAPTPAVRRTANSSVTAARSKARERIHGAGGLMIGGVRDPAEKAADSLADRVMRMPEPAGVVRRACAECAAEEKARRQVTDEEEETVRMRSGAMMVAPGAASAPAPAAAKAAIGAMGTGRPLSRSERAFFEPRFGADFSRVRVHDDAGAAQAARALHARAFTRGADIAYAAGERAGVDRLTAHELAHVALNTDATGPHVARRDPPARPPPAGPAPPAARVVSPVWNVQGRAVVVVESGGQQLAFYQRSGGSNSTGRARRTAAWRVGAVRRVQDKDRWTGPLRQGSLSFGHGPNPRAPRFRQRREQADLHMARRAAAPTSSGAALAGGADRVATPRRGGQPSVAYAGRWGAATAPSGPSNSGASGSGARARWRPDHGAPARGGGAGAVTVPKGTPGRTSGTGGAVAGAALVTFAILGKFALQKWLQGHFAPSIPADARRLVTEAIEGSRWWFDFYVIGPRQTEIQKAWAAGRQVRLRVVVDTEWVNTNIGRVMIKAEVAHRATELLFGSDTPFPYFRFQPKRGFWAELFNAPIRTLGWEEFEIPLESTEAPARPEPK